MKKENLFSEIMNYTVAGYVYFVAFTLVLYMVGSLVTGLLAMGSGLLEISSSPQDFLASATKDQFGYELLHTIAFTIVLVKAYKILVAFAEVRYFNLKFLIEIAIIAPIIELLFNSKQYPIEMNILLAAFALLSLTAYLLFYKTIRMMNADYEKERDALNKMREARHKAMKEAQDARKAKAEAAKKAKLEEKEAKKAKKQKKK